MGIKDWMSVVTRLDLGIRKYVEILIGKFSKILMLFSKMSDSAFVKFAQFSSGLDTNISHI